MIITWTIHSFTPTLVITTTYEITLTIHASGHHHHHHSRCNCNKREDIFNRRNRYDRHRVRTTLETLFSLLSLGSLVRLGGFVFFYWFLFCFVFWFLFFMSFLLFMTMFCFEQYFVRTKIRWKLIGDKLVWKTRLYRLVSSLQSESGYAVL